MPPAPKKAFPWGPVLFVGGVAAATFGSVRDTRATKAYDSRVVGVIELNPLLRQSGNLRPSIPKVIAGKAIIGGIGVAAYALLPKRWRWLGTVALWSQGVSGEIAKQRNDRAFR
jgi:hypothetical protein